MYSLCGSNMDLQGQTIVKESEECERAVSKTNVMNAFQEVTRIVWSSFNILLVIVHKASLTQES